MGVEPETSWAWDPTCKNGDVGCKADGIHVQCRFCGEAPYAPCPSCSFKLKPSTLYVWDNRCRPDRYTNGCFADGVHFECRFCGSESFDACPTTTMTSTSGPATSLSNPTGGHHKDFLSTTRSAAGITTQAPSWDVNPEATPSSGHRSWLTPWIHYGAALVAALLTTRNSSA